MRVNISDYVIEQKKNNSIYVGVLTQNLMFVFQQNCNTIWRNHRGTILIIKN